MYDFLIVGAGLSGAVFAAEAKKRGRKVLVIDKREHAGGNLYCQKLFGINVHKYGAHIFHTSNKTVWDYVNALVPFNNYINSPVANFEGKLFNLPFNMNTFYQMWGTKTPAEAKAEIDRQVKKEGITEPKNLEEKALSLVGRDIYQTLIKEYTEKQWGKKAAELPAFIISRLPLRFTFDNNYFNDRYQGIPVGGYNVIFDKLLEGVEVRLGADYFKNREYFDNCAKKTVFTGRIDEYYGNICGELEYRSLKFEEEILGLENYQGNAVVNYTSKKEPFTRILEHKHFEGAVSDKTVITREYPQNFGKGKEPFYPVNDEKNGAVYEKYKELAGKDKKVIFLGRLGNYAYYDMHVAIEKALEAANKHSG